MSTQIPVVGGIPIGQLSANQTAHNTINLDKNGNITKVAVDATSAMTNVKVGVYNEFGSLIEEGFIANVGVGTTYVPLNSPVSVVAGTQYILACLTQSGNLFLDGTTQATYTVDGVTLTLEQYAPISGNNALRDVTITDGNLHPPSSGYDATRWWSLGIEGEFNQPPNKPIAEYNSLELSKVQGSPTEIPTPTPTIVVSGTDPDPGDTLEYKLDAYDIDAASYVYTGVYNSDGNINPTGLVANKLYRIEPWSKDNNGAETQGDDYFIFIQLRYSIQVSEPIDATAGERAPSTRMVVKNGTDQATITNISEQYVEHQNVVTSTRDLDIVIEDSDVDVDRVYAYITP